MPYGSEYLGYGASTLPALSVNPVGFGAENEARLLANKQAQQQIDEESALAPYAIAAKKAQLQQTSTLTPIDTGNSVLAQVARDTQAADPADAPSVWDQGMKDAASKGVTAAGQYVGHYRPDLAERVSDIYGGGAGGKEGSQAQKLPPGFDPDATARMVTAATPQQRASLLKNWTSITSGFDRVRSEADWTQELATLRNAGIPVDNFIPANANWQLQYASVAPMVERMRAGIPYVQQAVANDSMGVPNPGPAPAKLTAGESLVNPTTGQILVTAPSAEPYQYVTNQTSGQTGILNKSTGELTSAVPGAGPGQPGDPFMGFARTMDAAENATGNPAAKNPNSSAQGNGQFINATWLEQARHAIPQTKSMTDAQVLALRDDPHASLMVTATYARENASALMNAGLPVTTLSLALAHRLGPDGAVKAMESPAGTPMAQLVSPGVLAANPDMKGKTLGQYAQGLANQVGNSPVVNANGESASVPGDAKLHGPDYLKSIPDQSIAAQVKAYDEGRIQQPSSFFMKTPYGQMMMRAIAQYDPGFDLSLYNSRVAANTDLAKGKMGQNVTSFNTAIGHLGTLQAAADALNNTSVPAVNYGLNWLARNTGDPRINAFVVARNAVADELTRAFRGTGGNESDIKAWEDTLNASASPQQLQAAISGAVNLLESRINAIGDQYNRAMRTKASISGDSLLSAHARQTLDALRARSGNAPANQQAASQIPAPLRNLPGLQFSPSRQQYKDASGKIYDKNGHPVQ